jgi:hypothetical protein
MLSKKLCRRSRLKIFMAGLLIAAMPSFDLDFALGIAGSLTIIPALAEAMFMIFGPGMMVWSAWVGIVMLRSSAAVPAEHDGISVRHPST